MSCFRPHSIRCPSKEAEPEYCSPGASTVHCGKASGGTFPLQSQASGLTVIFWTADWLILDVEAQHRISVIAKRNPGVAFLRCSIDAHTDEARAYGVHDLPAFHVFDGNSLVERLHGLASIASIEGVLEHYTFFQETDADTGSPATSAATCWANDMCQSPRCSSASEVSISHRSCGSSYDSSPSRAAQSATAHSARTLKFSLSGLSSTTGHSERSYLPQYTRQLFKPSRPRIASGKSAPHFAF